MLIPWNPHVYEDLQDRHWADIKGLFGSQLVLDENIGQVSLQTRKFLAGCCARVLHPVNNNHKSMVWKLFVIRMWIGSTRPKVLECLANQRQHKAYSSRDMTAKYLNIWNPWSCFYIIRASPGPYAAWENSLFVQAVCCPGKFTFSFLYALTNKQTDAQNLHSILTL